MKINIKKYRHVLVLGPLFLFIIIVIAYQVAGYFKSEKQDSISKDSISKLNTQLPSPAVQDRDKNKLEIYMQSQQDSIARRNELNNPSLKRFFNSASTEDNILKKRTEPDEIALKNHDLTEKEGQINNQIDKILKEVNNPSVDDNLRRLPEDTISYSPDITRLEQLIGSLQTDSAGDPELKQLDNMLNKIIQIQNPSTKNEATENDTDSSRKNYTVGLTPQSFNSETASVFYGLDEKNVSLSKRRTAIKAIVHETQTIQNGSTIKLKLSENTYIGQIEVPAGTFIYGTCNISDERLLIKISQIVLNNALYPVKLSAYDADGIAGIYIPGAITRDATKEGIDRSIQALTMSGFNTSIAAQATSAGIESLSSLLRKKVKQINVTVKAGHMVYLQ